MVLAAHLACQHHLGSTVLRLNSRSFAYLNDLGRDLKSIFKFTYSIDEKLSVKCALGPFFSEKAYGWSYSRALKL